MKPDTVEVELLYQPNRAGQPALASAKVQARLTATQIIVESPGVVQMLAADRSINCHATKEQPMRFDRERGTLLPRNVLVTGGWRVSADSLERLRMGEGGAE